jgi:hypothetical protein
VVLVPMPGYVVTNYPRLQWDIQGLHGDYFNDKLFKRKLQIWLNTLWQEKDGLLDRL